MRDFGDDGSRFEEGDFFLPGALLPEYVFVAKFRTHLFFDADITSSEELLGALKQLLIAIYGAHLKFSVWSYSEGVLLCRSSAPQLVSDVLAAAEGLRRNGNYHGLVLIDEHRRWGVFQSRPVDVGVLAMNAASDCCIGAESLLVDYFFTCRDVEHWMSGADSEAKQVCSDLGLEYLRLLSERYCSECRSVKKN